MSNKKILLFALAFGLPLINAAADPQASPTSSGAMDTSKAEAQASAQQAPAATTDPSAATAPGATSVTVGGLSGSTSGAAVSTDTSALASPAQTAPAVASDPNSMAAYSLISELNQLLNEINPLFEKNLRKIVAFQFNSTNELQNHKEIIKSIDDVDSHIVDVFTKLTERLSGQLSTNSNSAGEITALVLDLHRNKDKIMQKQAGLKALNNTLANQISSLVNKVELKQRQSDKMQVDCQKAKAEVSILGEKYSFSQAKLANLQSDLVDLGISFEKCGTDVAGLNTKIDQEKVKISGIQSQIEAQTKEITETNSRIDKLTLTKKNLQEQSNDLSRKNSKLQFQSVQSDDKKNSSITSLAELNGQIATITSEIANYNESNARLTTSNAGAGNEISAAEQQIVNAQAAVRELGQRCGEIKRLQDSYAKKLDKLQREIRDLESQKERLDREEAEKTDQLKALGSQNTQIGQEIASRNIEKTTLAQEITDLQGKIRTAAGNITTSEHDVEKLNKTLSTLGKSIDRQAELSQKLLSDLGRAIDNNGKYLTAQKTANTRDNKRVSDILAKYKGGLMIAQTRVTALLTEIDSKKASLDDNAAGMNAAVSTQQANNDSALGNPPAAS